MSGEEDNAFLKDDKLSARLPSRRAGRKCSGGPASRYIRNPEMVRADGSYQASFAWRPACFGLEQKQLQHKLSNQMEKINVDVAAGPGRRNCRKPGYRDCSCC